MLTKLLVSLLKSKLDAALAKAAGSDTVTIRGIAHGVKLRGQKYSVDIILRREEPQP